MYFITSHSFCTAFIKCLQNTCKIFNRLLRNCVGCSADEQTDLTTRLQELENEAEQLKNRADDVTCVRKTELATLHVDMLKEHGEMERERDRQHSQIAGERTTALAVTLIVVVQCISKTILKTSVGGGLW